MPTILPLSAPTPPLRLLLPLVLTFATSAMLPSRAMAGEITVPVEIAVGPLAMQGPGPLFDGVPLHSGLKIGLAAVLDQALIRKNLHRVPKQYRAMASQMKEVRYRPSIFIPDALWISPNLYGTGMIGVSWRPLGLALPLVDAGVRVNLEAGAVLSYAFIWSDRPSLPTTHFLRPGLDATLRCEIPFTETVRLYVGAGATAYVPQRPGRSVLYLAGAENDLSDSIWLLGGAFVQLAVRIPYTTSI
ncbi:MAG: hypothetical protein H6747_08430 [Deltaproteobacteria bacterium]|nr:hypothetical protein [Deltaproteobacteria bacterium]